MKKLLVVLMMMLVLVGCSAGETGGDSTEKVFKVGVIQLVQHEALDMATQGFVDALEAEFGDKVDVDVKLASGDSATCATIASSFVADGYDLILGNATPALQAAAHATSDIPVLGTSITEYGVALDIENFNGTPGGNVSGTSDLAPLDAQAQMIIDLFPEAKTVGLIYCSAEANSIYQVNYVKDYLEAKGLVCKVYSFESSNDVSIVVTGACEEIDVLYVPTDNTCASNGGVIENACYSAGVPVITGEKNTCISCGGVATYSIDYYDLGLATGAMAIRILNGEDISTMPVEYCNNPVKMYSKEMAELYNVTIPEDYIMIEE